MKAVAEVPPSYMCGYQFPQPQPWESEVACATLHILSAFRRELTRERETLVMVKGPLALAAQAELKAQYRWDRVVFAGVRAGRALMGGGALNNNVPVVLQESLPADPFSRPNDAGNEMARTPKEKVPSWPKVIVAEADVEESNRRDNILDAVELRHDRQFTAQELLVLLCALRYRLSVARDPIEVSEVHLVAAAHNLSLPSQVQ